MEIEEIIKIMKNIYTPLLDFVEATDNYDSEFEELIKIFEKLEIKEKEEEIRLLFQLISRIADNHHRTSTFITKLEQIFQYLINDKQKPISYFIPEHYKYNIRLLFLLFEKGFLKPDKSFLEKYLQSKPNRFFNRQISKFQSYYYLYPVMKEFIAEKVQKEIEKEILEKYEEEDISKFKEKCQIGENDSYICSLIREDSVEEFVSYVNRTNLKLSSQIKPSIFETNSFLIDKEPTLIEYAAFYGSIQIIQYLKYNQVSLTSSLWLYAIHSNNAELIHFLEDNEVKPLKNDLNLRLGFSINQNKISESFGDVLIESIKCHHNNISDYIKDNLLEHIDTNDQNQFNENYGLYIGDSLNFYYIPNDIKFIISKSKSEKALNLSQLCFSLTIVTIPSSVTSIGEGAFSECSSLTQITIPSSVISIGSSSFFMCTSIQKVLFDNPSSLISIGNYSFSKCSSLTKISIPSSVTKIGNSSFLGCTSLKQITIPSSVTEIGNSSFSGCTSLKQITIPSSVTSFGLNIFNGVKTLEIIGDIKHIPSHLFSKCSSLTQITITSSVTSIDDCSFSGCSSLTQITIPSSVTSIGNYSFSGCLSLTQITIPSSVTEIGNHSFSGCSSLTQISIPSSVTEIGNHSFSGCSSLKQITIPSSVTSIGQNVFNDCPLLPLDLKRPIHNNESNNNLF